jgi:hypothetical protein
MGEGVVGTGRGKRSCHEITTFLCPEDTVKCNTRQLLVKAVKHACYKNIFQTTCLSNTRLVTGREPEFNPQGFAQKKKDVSPPYEHVKHMRFPFLNLLCANNTFQGKEIEVKNIWRYSRYGNQLVITMPEFPF